MKIHTETEKVAEKWPKIYGLPLPPKELRQVEGGTSIRIQDDGSLLDE